MVFWVYFPIVQVSGWANPWNVLISICFFYANKTIAVIKSPYNPIAYSVVLPIDAFLTFHTGKWILYRFYHICYSRLLLQTLPPSLCCWRHGSPVSVSLPYCVLFFQT